jgi:hypothetical protein
LASPTASPMVSLTEPLVSFAAPAMRSLSMTTYSSDQRMTRIARIGFFVPLVHVLGCSKRDIPRD